MMAAMRDVFWDRIYKIASENKDIIVLAADFTAPSLDKFRIKLPNQFVFTGISEQNTILTAVGMALRGKKVFCYAIAPFLTMRCYEQIRLYLAGANLPITLVGVGAGMAYEDSGYTHQAYEDIALMRILPNMSVYIPSDNVMTEYIADLVVGSASPNYLRLDRYGDNAEDIKHDAESIKTGFNIVKPIQKVNIFACGNMVRNALEVWEVLNRKNIAIGIVDVCRIPFDSQFFGSTFRDTEKIISLEEHTLPGGLGSYILETVSDLDMHIKVVRKGLNLRNGYYEKFGGRAVMHKDYGIDVESIIKVVELREK